MVTHRAEPLSRRPRNQRRRHLLILLTNQSLKSEQQIRVQPRFAHHRRRAGMIRSLASIAPRKISQHNHWRIILRQPPAKARQLNNLWLVQLPTFPDARHSTPILLATRTRRIPSRRVASRAAHPPAHRPFPNMSSAAQRAHHQFSRLRSVVSAVRPCQSSVAGRAQSGQRPAARSVSCRRHQFGKSYQ